MDHLRFEKVANIPVPDLEVLGDKDDADLLIVGFGSTFGHLYATMQELRKRGHKVALAQFKYVNPLPKNTAEVLARYKRVVVAEQNLGQLAALLRIRINGFAPYQYNQVKGQPFVVSELVRGFEKVLKAPLPKNEGGTFYDKILQ
jgi:2-oxoglutarate ferredoxin oxidoreductase subunit alpha